MATGVDPASRSFTNTRAPCWSRLHCNPARLARHGARRGRGNVSEGKRRRRGWPLRGQLEASAPLRRNRRALHESYTIRTPNHEARAAFFPARRRSAVTSASAGVDRINKLPRAGSCLRAIAPDADRDGVGAGRGVLVAGAGAGGGVAGSSTVVSSTPGLGSRVATGVGDFRKNPTDNAASVPKTRNTATIGHLPLRDPARSSIGSSIRGGTTGAATGRPDDRCGDPSQASPQ